MVSGPRPTVAVRRATAVDAPDVAPPGTRPEAAAFGGVPYDVLIPECPNPKPTVCAIPATVAPTASRRATLSAVAVSVAA